MPETTINRTSSEEIRQKILKISYAEQKKRILERILHENKRQSKQTFTLNKHVRNRLEKLAVTNER